MNYLRELMSTVDGEDFFYKSIIPLQDKYNVLANKIIELNRAIFEDQLGRFAERDDGTQEYYKKIEYMIKDLGNSKENFIKRHYLDHLNEIKLRWQQK